MWSEEGGVIERRRGERDSGLVTGTGTVEVSSGLGEGHSHVVMARAPDAGHAHLRHGSAAGRLNQGTLAPCSSQSMPLQSVPKGRSIARYAVHGSHETCLTSTVYFQERRRLLLDVTCFPTAAGSCGG